MDFRGPFSGQVVCVGLPMYHFRDIRNDTPKISWQMTRSDQPTQPSDPVRVRAQKDGGKQFIFYPENDDLFMRTGQQVIQACQLGISIEVWLSELRDLVDYVASWARTPGSKVSTVFAEPRATRLVLFMVPKGEQFDFELADQLVVLEGELLTKFNVGNIETLQIPQSDLDRFIDQRHARCVYGQAEPHRPVEA